MKSIDAAGTLVIPEIQVLTDTATRHHNRISIMKRDEGTYPRDAFAYSLIVGNHFQCPVLFLILAIELGPCCSQSFCTHQQQT